MDTETKKKGLFNGLMLLLFVACFCAGIGVFALRMAPRSVSPVTVTYKAVTGKVPNATVLYKATPDGRMVFALISTGGKPGPGYYTRQAAGTAKASSR